MNKYLDKMINGITKNKKAVELTFQTIIVFIILVIVLIVMILFFVTHYGGNFGSIINVGNSTIDSVR